MTNQAIKLVYRMVLATMAGKHERTEKLYEQYLKETRLHVPISEYLDWKKERTA